MQPAVLIRLRPLGPWRYGPGEGGSHRLDIVFRSDRLYSAVTLALQQLGFLDEWLQATALADTPAVTFSSLFPFQGDTMFAPPPATLWPPPPSLLTSPSPVFLAKMRWEAIRFIPLTLVEALVTGQPVLADQWVIEAESGCLLRRDRPSQSPFRVSNRSRVAVDRLTGTSGQSEQTACVEFENGSGLWLVMRFRDQAAEESWSFRIRSAFRLLADTGFGGGRTSGWGQTAEPEWQAGSWPGLLLPHLHRKGQSAAANEDDSRLFWLLSLYAPASTDEVDWKAGDYHLTVRGGRIQSQTGSGTLKKTVRMVAEGSVLSLAADPVGAAVDVAPDGFAHPVYRAGFALALRLPTIRQTPIEPVEDTPAESSLESAREAESEALPMSTQSDVADEEQATTPEPESASMEHKPEEVETPPSEGAEAAEADAGPADAAEVNPTEEPAPVAPAPAPEEEGHEL